MSAMHRACASRAGTWLLRTTTVRHCASNGKLTRPRLPLITEMLSDAGLGASAIFDGRIGSSTSTNCVMSMWQSGPGGPCFLRRRQGVSKARLSRAPIGAVNLGEMRCSSSAARLMRSASV